MAARVVWLVANGYARPGEVLGLTFTRKAAGQLLRRVRTRLARLAGAGLVAGAQYDVADDPATVSTYHAFAGTLLREHGLLLPVEPDTRLLSETELWQLAFRVVCEYPRRLRHRQDAGRRHRDGAAPGGSAGRTSRRHRRNCATPMSSWNGWCTRCPPARISATADPASGCCGCWPPRPNAPNSSRSSTHCTGACGPRRCMDFGMQMASAARLASTFPQVGAQLRQRYRVVLLDEYQDTGHAQRVALSSLFGGGVDDGLALTAVGDPIQSIYGWRGASATNLPRFTTDFPRADGTPAPTLELRTSWRNPPARAAPGQRGVRRRPDAGRSRVRELRPRPDAEPGTIRCALLSDVVAERDWVADHLARVYPVRAPTAARADRRGPGAPQRRRRADGRGADRARRPGRGGRAGRAARRPRGRRRGRDAAPGRRPDRRARPRCGC